MGSTGKRAMKRQLRRQSIWLGESLRWIIGEKVLAGENRPRALDVGSGPGFVADSLGDLLDVTCLDIDPDMLKACQARGFRSLRGSALDLPFGDGAFDVVYSTFLLLWLEDPDSAVREMSRVSRSHVLCLAEPDYGARIDWPQGLEPVRGLIIDGVRAQGGDPYIGRKLRDLFRRNGLSVRIGVHSGVWSIDRLRQEQRDEWEFVRSLATDLPEDELDLIDSRWRRALRDGSLLQFNPIFYALGVKRTHQNEEYLSRHM